MFYETDLSFLPYVENFIIYLKNIQAYLFYYIGIETTRVTVLVFMLQLLHHQQIMKNIQDEIDDVIGRSRSPKIEDKAKLPYLQAAIYETLRLCYLYLKSHYFTYFIRNHYHNVHYVLIL